MSDDKRNMNWFTVIAVGAFAASMITLIFTYVLFRLPAPTAPGPKPPGCLVSTGPDVYLNVGDIDVIDARAYYGACNGNSEIRFPDPPGTVGNDIIAGGRARLQLVSPLFAGRIEPISQEIQAIDEVGDIGRWSWQIQPTKEKLY